MKKRAVIAILVIIVIIVILLLLRCDREKPPVTEELPAKPEETEHGEGGKNVYSEVTFKAGPHLTGIPMHSWQENLSMVDFQYLNAELNTEDKTKGTYKVTSNEGKVFYTDNVFATRKAEAKDIEPGLYVICIDVPHVISDEDQKTAGWKVRRVKSISGDEVEVEFYDTYWTRWTPKKCHLRNIRIPLEKMTEERVKKVKP
jgi:hypothetical protein